MKISTKGRYAVRVMLDLAQQPKGQYISLKDIADRQQISMKYLEMIMRLLTKADFVKSHRGKEGGYCLHRSPQEYNLEEILELAEGSIAPVACLACPVQTCERAPDCLTLPVWEELNRRIRAYLRSVTLVDVLAGKVKKEEIL